MKKIIPFLWFDNQAEEAVKFYTSIFKNSKILNTTYFDEASAKAANMPVGTVLTIGFELNGQEFGALNGGPVFKFTEAISLMVMCNSQEEVDYIWEKLSADPKEGQCGWLKDKYGVSWQIVPSELNKLLNDPDPVKAKRAMEAMLQMKKIDINEIKKAVGG
jgi:predicted 3-demethylubiquinone-9 3-methyltransferase (glyoxalase superfamily)